MNYPPCVMLPLESESSYFSLNWGGFSRRHERFRLPTPLSSIGRLSGHTIYGLSGELFQNKSVAPSTKSRFCTRSLTPKCSSFGTQYLPTFTIVPSAVQYSLYFVILGGVVMIAAWLGKHSIITCMHIFAFSKREE